MGWSPVAVTYLFDICNLNKNSAVIFHTYLSLRLTLSETKEIILVFKLSFYIFSDMLSLNIWDSIIHLKDSLLSISFWGKSEDSGMLLMGFLGVFTDTMDDDCLVLGAVKDKSLAWWLEYCSILKSTKLSLTRYESSFLIGLFTIFPWIISSLILWSRCYLLLFS